MLECANCGHENPAGAGFCGSCGTALAQSEAAVTAPFQPMPAPASQLFAGFWRRFGAAAIDTVLAFAMVGIAQSILRFVTAFTLVGDNVGFGLVIVLAGLVALLLPWAYYVILTGIRGQTVGKMALGIKVVDVNGNIPGLGRAALREIVGKIISGLVLWLGFLWTIWDPNKQGWHDKLASTYVILARVPEARL